MKYILYTLMMITLIGCSAENRTKRPRVNYQNPITNPWNPIPNPGMGGGVTSPPGTQMPAQINPYEPNCVIEGVNRVSSGAPNYSIWCKKISMRGESTWSAYDEYKGEVCFETENEMGQKVEQCAPRSNAFLTDSEMKLRIKVLAEPASVNGTKCRSRPYKALKVSVRALHIINNEVFPHEVGTLTARVGETSGVVNLPIATGPTLFEVYEARSDYTCTKWLTTPGCRVDDSGNIISGSDSTCEATCQDWNSNSLVRGDVCWALEIQVSTDDTQAFSL